MFGQSIFWRNFIFIQMTTLFTAVENVEFQKCSSQQIHTVVYSTSYNSKHLFLFLSLDLFSRAFVQRNNVFLSSERL